MLRAALHQVVEWQPERVFANIRIHTDRIARCARSLGLSVPTHYTHIIGIRVQDDLAALALHRKPRLVVGGGEEGGKEGCDGGGADGAGGRGRARGGGSSLGARVQAKRDSYEATQQLYTFLRTHNVHVSLRAGAIRVSPHVYNTNDEVAWFCQLLRRFVHGGAQETVEVMGVGSKL